MLQSAYRLGYEMDDRGSTPGKGSDGIFLRHSVQTDSGADATTYRMG